MCTGCSITHPSIKVYRGHRFTVIADKPTLKPAKKRVVRFDEETLAKGSLLSASQVSIEEVREIGLLQSLADIVNSYVRADDWHSRVVVMIVTFALYALLKLFLGRLSVVILVVGAFAVIRNANATKSPQQAQSEGDRGWWEELKLEVRELFQATEVLLKGNTSEGQAAIEDLNRVRQELYSTTTELSEYDEKEFSDEFWHNTKPRRRKMAIQVKGDSSVIIR